MKLKILSMAVVIAAALLGATPGQAADPAVKPVRVLIIDGQNNHDWKSTTPVLKQALESAPGRFSVVVSTSPPGNAKPEDWEKWRPDFAKYDAVLSNYNGQPWPVQVKLAFEKYVREGGGFVCVHAADNSFPEWPEYNKMIGLGGWGGRNEKSGPYVFVRDGQVVRDSAPGSGGSHGAQVEFNVELYSDGKDHPVTKGLPANWKHAKDELYNSLRGPAENLHILAFAFSTDTKKNEPMIMTIDYGKGRVFHTPMGHADYSMKDVGFRTVLQRGTEWAATGAVTIPVPANFPGKDAVVPTP